MASCYGHPRGPESVKSLLLEQPAVQDQRAVVLCGEISVHRRFLSDKASSSAGLTLIHCSEDPAKTISIVQQLNASVLVAREEFIERLTPTTVLQLTDFGRGCRFLAVLGSETLETPSSARMLRLGCQGVLPRKFSPKIFRRAVLAILGGEFWAPRRLLAELLSELLREASLKTDRGLTPQEARILELTSQGYTNSAIADTLFISQETVRWHKRRLNRKLRERNQPKYPRMKATPPIRQNVG